MVTTRMIGLLFAVSFALAGYGAGVEQYIPIGQSPGLSKEGKTVIGVVGDVDFPHRKVVIGCTEVQLSKDTVVYLDGSVQREPSTVGDWGDIIVDAVVEAYPPKWIKVRQ